MTQTCSQLIHLLPCYTNITQLCTEVYSASFPVLILYLPLLSSIKLYVSLCVCVSVRTALIAIIGFMPTKGEGAIGSLDYTPEERKALAKK